MRKLYPIFGIIASLLYVSAVLLGGFLRDDYSHVSNAISELIMTNAPNKNLLDLIFTIYNICLAIFGFSTYFYLNNTKTKLFKSASVMLGVIGILGLLMYFFSQDPRGAAVTVNGIIHIVLAGIMSLLTILTVFLAGLSFGKEPEFKGFKIYSIISGLIILSTGGISAIITANGSAYMGLFERLTIGTFILWIFVFASKVICSDKKRNSIDNI